MVFAGDFPKRSYLGEEFVPVCGMKKAGDAICPPYLFFLEEGMLQDGKNELVAEVTNTLDKAHHDNVFDRYWVQEPTGLLGPVKVEYMEE